MITTEEQSKNLLSLGLDPNTSDYYLWYSEDGIYEYPGQIDDPNAIPAWSADRLIELIDNDVAIYKRKDVYTIIYKDMHKYGDTLLEAGYQMMHWLLSKK